MIPNKKCNMKLRWESTLLLVVYFFGQVLHLTRSHYQLTKPDPKNHRGTTEQTVQNDEKSTVMSLLLGEANTKTEPKSDDNLKLNLKQIMNNPDSTLNKTINRLVKQIQDENVRVAYSLDEGKTFLEVYLEDCYDPSFDGQKLNVFSMPIKKSLQKYFGSKSMQKTLKFAKLSLAEQKKRERILKKNMEDMMKLVLECVLKVRPKSKFGLTSVSHLSKKEFRNMQGFKLNDANRAKVPVKKYRENLGDDEIPETFDAREKGFSTSVKSQGQTCGSCFIFTAMAALENQYLMINEGKVKPEEVDYSEQAVLDCMEPGTCENGGLASFVYEYLMNHDVVDEETSPYQGQQGSCNENLEKSKHLVKVKKHATFEGLDQNDPQTIQRRMIKFGAVYMAICGHEPALQHLKGKFSGSCCTSLSHAVTLIGWDKEYWIIKNSWGPDWGEEGHLYLPREENKCGFGQYASIVYIEGGCVDENDNSTTKSDKQKTTKSSSDTTDSTNESKGGETTKSSSDSTDSTNVTKGGETTKSSSDSTNSPDGSSGTTKSNSKTTSDCPPNQPTSENSGTTASACPCKGSTAATTCPPSESPEQPTPADSASTKCPCSKNNTDTVPETTTPTSKTTRRNCDDDSDKEIDRYVEQIAKKNKHVAKTIRETKKLQKSISSAGLSHCYDPEFHGEHFNMFELSPDQAVKKYFKMKPIKSTLKFTALADSAKEEKVQTLAENMKEITKLVLDCVSGKKPKTRFGLTSISHLSREEFRHLLGFKLANSSAVARLEPYSDDLGDDDIPRVFDWRQKGFVTPVKNQMACSSCFIFSAIGMAESQYLLMNEEKVQVEDVDLSEQAVLNCMEPFSCERGGYPGFVYDFLRTNNAVDEETEPYIGRQGTCNTKLPKTKLALKVGTNQDYMGVEQNSQRTIQRRIMKYGPLNGAICASYDFQFLRGKYHGQCCQGLNHAILIVGWTEEYWIIKNSWGTRWGLENGYLYLPREEDKCGIQQFTCVLNLVGFEPSNIWKKVPKHSAKSTHRHHTTTKKAKHTAKKPHSHHTTKKSAKHSTKRPPSHHTTTKKAKHTAKKPHSHHTTKKSAKHSTKRPPSHHTTTKKAKHTAKKPHSHHTTKSAKHSAERPPSHHTTKSAKKPPSHHCNHSTRRKTGHPPKHHTTKKIIYPTKKPWTERPPKHHTTPSYVHPTNKPRTIKPEGPTIEITIMVRIILKKIRQKSKIIVQALKEIENLKEKIKKASNTAVKKCYDPKFQDHTVNLVKTPLEDAIDKIFGLDSVQLSLKLNGVIDRSMLEKKIQTFIVNAKNMLGWVLKCVEKGNLKTRFGLTPLSFMDNHEFKSMLGYRTPIGSHQAKSFEPYQANLGDDEIPEKFDWRDSNCVPPIRNQQTCASCFIFSSVAMIECQYLVMKNGEVKPEDVDLSEQFVLDCLPSGTCQMGGWPAHVYDFLKKHDIVDEATKPYKNQQGWCETDLEKSKTGAKVKDYEDFFGVDNNKQEDIQRRILKYGPVNAAMCVSNDMSYLRGKYDGSCCQNLNHLVLLIGWDKEYWIAKNSFGTEWGVNGFLYLPRNEENKCGIQQHINCVTLTDFDPNAHKNATSSSPASPTEEPSIASTDGNETTNPVMNSTTEDPGDKNSTSSDLDSTTEESSDDEDSTESDSETTTEKPSDDKNSTKSDSETTTEKPSDDEGSTKSDSETTTQDPCGRRSTKSGSNSTTEAPPDDKNSTKSDSSSTTEESPDDKNSTKPDSGTTTQNPCPCGKKSRKKSKK